MNNFYCSFKGLFLVVCLFQLPAFLLAQPELRTSRASGYYEAGESMNFLVDPIASGEISYKIYYDEKTEPIRVGTVFAGSSNADVAIPFTLNEPGVVFCEVEQFNQKDLVVAAFSPFEITQSEPEPDDFDEFWDGLKADLAAVPMSPNLEQTEETDYATTYRISLRQIDNRRVYGYLSVPKGNGPFPGVLELPAFGDNPISSSDIVAERAGAIYMKIVIHNAPANQSDPNAYEPDIIDDPDQNYFRWAVLAGLRSLDYIASRPEWDGENMAVTGVSQGGALSTMVAGLDDRVTLMSVAHPSHHEHAGNANGVASGWPFYLQQANQRGFSYEGTRNATRYYDAINFAKRYDGKVMAFISYEDEISLAPGIFAAFNHYKNEKILMHWLDNGHNPNPAEYWNGRFDFWRRHIPSTQTPPWPWPDSDQGYGIDAGDDIETSTNSVVLNGRVEHNELTNPNWDLQWSKVSGPGNVNFANAGAYLTAATFSEEGTYVLQLMATDDRELADDQKYWTLMDYITVKIGDVVNPPPPTDLSINCPQNQTINLPFGSSGTIVSWNLPTVQTDCSGNTNVFKIGGISNNSFQTAGTYTIRYRATDGCNNSEECSFTIRVNAGIEPPPPPPTGEYCDAEGEQPWQFWIRRVKLEDINNTSVKEGYEAFLDQSTKLSGGNTYTIELTTGYSWASSRSYWKVWIDYNGNGSFENAEAVVTKIQNGPEDGTPEATTSASFTVPGNAAEGTTRMRVAMSPDRYPQACGEFEVGEVEDYTIEIEDGGSTQTNLTAFCRDNIIATASLGSNGINVGWEQPSASTSCGGGSVEIIQTEGPSPGSFITLGSTTIAYMIGDDCGNITSCSFTITILPNNPPPPNGQYCYAEGDNPWTDYIKRVRISSIDQYSGKDGYADFTDERGYVTAGGDKYIILDPGNNENDQYWTVYIDFNQDKDFTDAGEEVVRLHGFGEQGTSFDIPNNALGGNTRMRVVMQRGSYASSCGAFDNGEVEDYTITVTGASSFSSIVDNYLELSAAINQPGASTLTWVTNQDEKAVGYQIERAGEDGIFTILETIEVDDPATYAIMREYVDAQPLLGANTYRVVQLRADDTAIVSAEAQLQFGVQGSLFPNPTSAGVYVDINNYDEAVQVEIFAADGKRVDQQTMQTGGLGYIDLSRFENGLYLLKFNVTGKVWAERVLLKK